MITIPKFQRNIEYRELSPLEGKYKYRFILLKPITFTTTFSLFPDNIEVLFRDMKNREWMKMTQNSIIIPAQYAWNGASPKKYVKGLGWIGIMDFPKTMLAIVVHDALCQFLDADYFPLHRADCDDIFRTILDKNDFKLTDMYYIGATIGTLLNLKTTTQSKSILNVRIDK